ncbi:MAG: diguanylate cyclase [Sphingobacteriia bacterium]|nr:diguanylate cyclase [Sphingobacteriia bacterium]NCC40423.1 diguanylate cyclase [Gammaproteobacteria bacterium]
MSGLESCLSILVARASAGQLAEKLRALVALTPFATVGAVTASFGVTEYRPGERLDDWLQRADQALDAAKAGGRNRVCLAETGLTRGNRVKAQRLIFE